MDVLNSPLNSAHQQSRKADRFLVSGKFEDAILCHKNAADYLTKAMAMTMVQQALESLSLQRNFHLRQQEVIKHKQHQAALVEHQTSKLKSPPGGDGAQVNATPHTPEDPAAWQETLVMQTMNECDSLVALLNERAASGGKSMNLLPQMCHKVDENSAIAAVVSKEVQGGVTLKKDEHTMIEELRVHNDALRGHVLDLLKESEDQRRQIDYYQSELDHYRKETETLHRRLQDHESNKNHPGGKLSDSGDDHYEENYFSINAMAGMALDDLTTIELPPLEIPKFDYDIKP